MIAHFDTSVLVKSYWASNLLFVLKANIKNTTFALWLLGLFLLTVLICCLDTQEGVQVTVTDSGVDDGNYCVVCRATKLTSTINIKTSSNLPTYIPLR